MVGRAGATVLGSTVDLAQTADTNGLANVYVTGDGGGADVEPEYMLAGFSHVDLHGDIANQSMDCGGSSLAWEVLTVSLQPVDSVSSAQIQALRQTTVPRSARDSGFSDPLYQCPDIT